MADDVLAQAGWLDPGALERDRHPRVSSHVLELAQLRVQMRGDQLVAFDRGQTQSLRTGVRVDGDQVAERARADQLLGAFGEGHGGRA